MSDLKEYLGTLRIRRVALGGFDREDVYRVIQEIDQMQRKRIEELESENASLVQKMSEVGMEEPPAGSAAEAAMRQRLEVLDQAIRDYRKGGEHLLGEARNEAAALIEEARGQAGGIVGEARVQAARVLDEAKQAAQRVRESETMAAAQERERAQAAQREARDLLQGMQEMRHRLGTLMDQYAPPVQKGDGQ